MNHEIKKYLQDILECTNSIEDYVGEKKDFKEYVKNKMLIRAVEREIEIIGKAMNRILRVDPDINIENSIKIVNTRNWVIHGYDFVDDVIIWSIITKHAPNLKIEVEKLLKV